MGELISYDLLRQIQNGNVINFNDVTTLKQAIGSTLTGVGNYVYPTVQKLSSSGLGQTVQSGASIVSIGSATTLASTSTGATATTVGTIGTIAPYILPAIAVGLACYYGTQLQYKIYQTEAEIAKALGKKIAEYVSNPDTPDIINGEIAYVEADGQTYVSEQTLQFIIDLANEYLSLIEFKNFDTPTNLTEETFILPEKAIGDFKGTIAYAIANYKNIPYYNEIVERDRLGINLGYNSLMYYYDNMPEFKEIVDNSICITTNGYVYIPAGGFSNYQIHVYAYDKKLFDFTEPITLYRNKLPNWTNKDFYKGVWSILNNPDKTGKLWLKIYLSDYALSLVSDGDNYIRLDTHYESQIRAYEVEDYTVYPYFTKDEQGADLRVIYDEEKNKYFTYLIDTSLFNEKDNLRTINLGISGASTPFTKSTEEPITSVDDYQELVEGRTKSLDREAVGEPNITLYPLDVITPQTQVVSVPSVITRPMTDLTDIEKNIIADNVSTAIEILQSIDVIDTSKPIENVGNNPIQLPFAVPVNAGFFNIYSPTINELRTFNQELWSENIITQLKNMFTNPLDSILSLHMLYATPQLSTEKTNIICGYTQFNVQSNTVTNSTIVLDFGTVTINECFGNYLDYEPYTKMSIYLPFIGYQDINTSIFTNAQCNIIYKIDVLTGVCVAELRCIKNGTNQLINTFSGNMGVHLPVTSGSYLGILAGTLSATAQTAMYNFGGAVSSLANMRTSVQSNGNLTANYSALAHKTPYIQITRSNPYVANNFNSYIGIQSAVTVQLKQLTGYTKVKDVHLENINATDDELNMIAEQLKEGVIL